jgi:serine/threonine-protein kinase
MPDSKSKFEALLKRLAAPAQAPLWADPPPLREGLEIDGTYRIVRLLGRGGMGEVYLAEHLSSGTQAALKCLRLGVAEDAAARQRFEAEARAAGRLGHQNIVEVFGTGALPDGRRYLAMERLEGQTLQDVVDREGRVEEPRLLAIAVSLCGALSAAHAGGIVHRDLKPANVFLSPPYLKGNPPAAAALDDAHGAPAIACTEHVKLTDFGVAKLLHQPGARLTTSGIVLGTPHFMAPEQVRGEGMVDQRVDVYAMGVLLYYCGSGRFPFDGRTFAELAVNICTREPSPPEGVSADLAAIISIAMQKDPTRRFVSALAFQTALDEARALTAKAKPGFVL